MIAAVEDAARDLSAFLHHAYGNEVPLLENGIDGQSVAHAHLHLIPVRASLQALPPARTEHPDVQRVHDWDEVARLFRREGAYRYVEFHGERWGIRPRRRAVSALRGLIADATGAEWGEADWVRRTNGRDIEELRGLWTRARDGRG